MIQNKRWIGDGHMKVVVLGAGLMGKETARDLIKSDDVRKSIFSGFKCQTGGSFCRRTHVR